MSGVCIPDNSCLSPNFLDSLCSAAPAAIVVHMEDNPSFLTTREAAELFRVGHSTIIRWARAGILEYIQPGGGRYLFPVTQPLIHSRIRRSPDND